MKKIRIVVDRDEDFYDEAIYLCHAFTEWEMGNSEDDEDGCEYAPASIHLVLLDGSHQYYS